MLNTIMTFVNCYFMYNAIKDTNYAFASICAFAALAGLLTMKIQEIKTELKSEEK